MQEISNSLRQRLGARPQPQTHPDPDTLSAYVEQVLSPAERVRIIEHLADCRDCREVVALSLPQLEPQQPVLQTAPRSRWWAPAYRWATLAATIAVATTLIVERPWQKQSPNTPSRQQQAAVPSGKTESANPSARQTADLPTLSEPDKASRATTVARSNALGANDRLQDTKTPAESGRNTSENPPLPRAARRTTVGGVVGGVPAGTSGLAVQQAVAPATVMAHQPAVPPPPPNVADGEIVNRNGADLNSAGSKETVELAAAADTVLPVAPAPQPADKQGAVRKIVPPPLGHDNLRNAMAPEIVPPNVSSTGPPPSPKDNTLSASGFGKKSKPSKIKSAESTVIDAAKRAMEAANPVKPPSGAGQGFVGAAMAPPAKLSEARPEFRRESSQKLHWSISPEGVLRNSTDFTQWHEVNTQTPDIQFRVVVTRGDQVWAGGSKATLIHSWDGGVNWDTMKVPDAGDITQITIDDGWQVKTSNGQTFVSSDHGKTWVPLEQPK